MKLSRGVFFFTVIFRTILSTTIHADQLLLILSGSMLGIVLLITISILPFYIIKWKKHGQMPKVTSLDPALKQRIKRYERSMTRVHRNRPFRKKVYKYFYIFLAASFILIPLPIPLPLLLFSIFIFNQNDGIKMYKIKKNARLKMLYEEGLSTICPECEYDLKTLNVTHCPECGYCVALHLKTT